MTDREQTQSSSVKVSALTDAGIPAMFKVGPGNPSDACPNCHIHRQYAGNPLACGRHHLEPGCFARWTE